MASSVFLALGDIAYSGTVSATKFLSGDGTVALPAYSYSADTDLGSYRIGANNEGFSAGGALVFDYNASRVLFAQPIYAADGTASAPSIAFGSQPGLGIYKRMTDYLAVGDGTFIPVFFGGLTSGTESGMFVASGGAFGFSSGVNDASAATDVYLRRDAANILAQRNGTNAQTFRVYNTYASSTSNEFLLVDFNANIARILTNAGSGGGTVRALQIGTSGSAALNFAINNSNVWSINTSGNIVDSGTHALTVGGTTTLATSLTGILRADSGVVSVDSASSTEVIGVAAGYKVARGSTALDGANPTTVATGLTTVVAFVATLLRTSALTSGTAFLTHAVASGANVDVYGWILAGTASSGTETFEWVCVGT